MKMITNEFDSQCKIEKIISAKMTYVRPRVAGCNARLPVHGQGGEIPITAIQIAGVWGFGWSPVSRKQAEAMIGMPLISMFNEGQMLKPEFKCIEFPILDWIGQTAKKPVYELVSRQPETCKDIHKVPVYDTSIYFDELDIENDEEAVEFTCKEVDFGLANGHRNFKVKIGRCGMWMDLEKGLKRDIDIVLAIRKRIGTEGKLMVDANNGYNCNLTKKFLDATRSADLFWIEEPFHEDDRVYTELRKWMNTENINTMIADGEGLAAPVIVDWACKGIIDVLQYDLRSYGFFNWMELGKRLDECGVKCAPHNYGGFYGNYAQGHITTAIKGYTFAEWDQASVDGIDTSEYTIKDGYVNVPNLPGFGLKLDMDKFMDLARQNGWIVE